MTRILFLFILIPVYCLPCLANIKPSPTQSNAVQIEARVLELLNAGKQSTAEEFLGKHIPAYRDNQRIVFLLACCLRSRFSSQEAAMLFTVITQLGTNSLAGQCSYHILFLDQGIEPDKHFDALRNLVDNNPNDMMLRWMLAVQCRTYNKNEEGVKHYAKLLENWNPGPVLVHQTYGNLLDELKRYDEALIEHRKAVLLEPAGWSYEGLGNTLTSLKRYKEANIAYANAVACSPNYHSYWTSWALKLLKEERYSEAIAKCQKAIALTPNDRDALCFWARCLELQGKLQDAVAKYKAVLEIKENDDYARKRFKDLEAQLSSKAAPSNDKPTTNEVRVSRRAIEKSASISIQVNQGHNYLIGQGVPQDFVEAKMWYRKASDQGCIDAQHSLGYVYDLEQNYSEAAKWYRSAVEHGHCIAMSSLGMLYELGLGVIQDQKEAIKLYRGAAEFGSPAAQVNLARCYWTGQGVPQDYALAVKWYRQRAEHRNAQAQFFLGLAYHEGRGVPQNDTESLMWYRKAAENGYAQAQRELGLAYREGRGIPRDILEAYIWLSIAVVSGDKKSVALLDETIMHLTPEQITEGDKRAAKFNLEESQLKDIDENRQPI
jgi:TPR repeat protein